MKSFGVWFKKSASKDTEAQEEACKKMSENESKETDKEGHEVDIHINLWDIIDSEPPFIDIGLKVKNYQSIDKLALLIPFDVDESDIEDLSGKFDFKGMPNLIFNDSCTFIRKEDYTEIILSENEEELLICKFDTTCRETPNVMYEKEESSLRIIFDMQYYKNDLDTYDNLKNLYIRFRVKSEKIKDELFCKINQKDGFLNSKRKLVQIIDLKINKKRNMSEEDIIYFRKNSYDFQEFRRVHFLIMQPVETEVDKCGNDFFESRNLEEEWSEYIYKESDTNWINLKDKKVLVYHWKQKPEGGSKIGDYGKTVRIISEFSSKKIIFLYIIGVLVLSALGNALYSLILKLL